jgi:hypothetical protein
LIEKLSKVLSAAQISRLARETGFVKRESKKVDALKFVKMLLFDQLRYDQPSLQQHAFELLTDKAINISKQGVDKRFKTAAVEFITKLFESYLAHSINCDGIATKLKDKYKAVRVMDSTEFKLPDSLAKDFPGYSASNALACAAIQFEYDVISKSISCMAIENAKVSDKTYADKRMDNIKAGELIIRDLGYYSIDSYEKIEKQGAFYISRLKSQISIYEKDENGEYKELSLQTLIERIKKSGNPYVDQPVYIGAEDRKQVRLMAWLLEEDVQKRRLQKKQSKKGKLNNNDILWSMLNVFITNVPGEELTVQQAYDLYKIRWQIELVFKVWKSILKIHLVRKMKPERVRCYLYGKLLWVLLCWDITVKFEPLIWKQKGRLLSLYKCYALLKTNAQQLGGILFNAREKLKEWLLKMLQWFGDFGLKENKKGRKNLIELLQIISDKPTKKC